MDLVPCPICETPFDPESDYNGWRVVGTQLRTRCSHSCRIRDAVHHKGPKVDTQLVPCGWCQTPFDPKLNPDGTRSKQARGFCGDACKEANRKDRQKAKQNKRTGRA